MKSDTVQECAFVNTRQTIPFRERYGCEIVAFRERVIINRNKASGKRNFRERIRVIERSIAKRQKVDVFRKIHCGKCGVFKCAEANRFHRFRYGKFTRSTRRECNEF